MTQFAHADEIWRPATRSLLTELPDLVRRLHRDGFDVFRVMYNPHDWDNTPRRGDIRGRTLKLGSYQSQDRGVITVVDGSNRNRVRVTAVAAGTAA